MRRRGSVLLAYFSRPGENWWNGGRRDLEVGNTEDDANHAHSVWRDPTNDFGRDPLMEHLVGEHRDGGTHHHG